MVPVFNEEIRSKLVLESLLIAFKGVLIEIIVIDDCSTDKTSEILKSFVLDNTLCKVHRNTTNVGHGPSVIRGMSLALESSASHVLTYDGDGFLDPHEISRGIQRSLKNDHLILEMVRVGRTDPLYRRMVTSCLRRIVLLLTQMKSSDPNTPSRLIPKSILREFLNGTANLNPVPNLWFSIFARLKEFQIMEIGVSVAMEPALNVRNSWNSKLRAIPSLGFVLFCLKAVRFWKWKKA